MILTIGIIVYNEEKNIHWIERTIRQLQSYCRVIVIDNCSLDSTFRLLTDLQGTFSFELYRREVNHLGEARASVVEMADSDWVGFVDADCDISEAWMGRVLQCCDQMDSRVGAFGGPLLPMGKQSDRYQLLFSHYLGSLNSPQVKFFYQKKKVNHIPTANVIYRRELLIKLGNFSHRFQFVGEDLDLSYRISRAGYMLLLDPAFAVGHIMPDDLVSWLKKVVKYGKGRARVSCEYGDIFSPNFILPWLFVVFFYSNFILVQMLLGLPLLTYFVLMFLVISFLCIKNKISMTKSMSGVLWIFLTQLSYSHGVLIGTFYFLILKLLELQRHLIDKFSFKEV